MDFLEDYWTYHRCYEIPRNHAWWAGIGMLSALFHKKLKYLHGDIEIYANMYVGLIGPQGVSKSTTNSFAKRFFLNAWPEANIGPSRASPEVLVKLMAADGFEKAIYSPEGEMVAVRPYAFFINEFKNFVGRSPIDMINFLTDIYDQKVYDGSTIVRGVELITEPVVSMIICEVPDWFINGMKTSLITGGIFRRFVLIYEKYCVDPIPNPFITPEAREAEARIKKRLLDTRTFHCLYTWGDAQSFYDAWYRDNFKRYSKETNPMMQGYLKSKNVQLYKVMMNLDAVNDKPTGKFNKDLFDLAIALLDKGEKNLNEIAMSAGRNETLQGQHRILALLRSNGGMVLEKTLKIQVESEFKNPLELYSSLKHLEDTEQLTIRMVEMENSDKVWIKRKVVFTKEKFVDMQKEGKIRIT